MDDATLLEALRRGDEAAFASLVSRHHVSMVRVARLYVGSSASAEDVAQETWIAVLRGLDQFEGRSSLATWMFRILVNRARSAGVREHRSIPVDVGASNPSVAPERFNEGGMWAAPPVPFTEVVDGRLSNAEALAALRVALSELPQPSQAVVTLRDVEGLSTREVAELLELSEGNVRVILHRARAVLRASLEATDREEGS